jgi:hypothetical protein
MNLQSIRQFFFMHRLTGAILMSIVVAVMLTMISVSLYIRSGASRLDLSRPGYEKVREQVKNDNENDSFSATGPMNADVIDEFQAIYSKKRATIGKLDPFSPSILDDDSIRLLDTPDQQPQ